MTRSADSTFPVSYSAEVAAAMAAGEAIVTLEAMKMETVVSAPCAGTLECLAAPGDMLTAGQRLARVRG